MKIAIGSCNKVKVQAVCNAAEGTGCQVVSCAAQSSVSEQPIGEEETRLGAVMRAKDCLLKTDAEVGIGIEGGVFFWNDEVYLCHWGALVDRQEKLYVTNSPILLLPRHYKEDLLQGRNLDCVMHMHTGIESLGKKQGAIGYFTNNRLTREDVLTQIAKTLLGLYDFHAL